jgi:uncharacterized protein YigA (DUF484 family)
MNNTNPKVDNSDQEDLSSQKVEEYLHHHPEFFHQHLDLLENMSIPHPSGNAVSLIAKQLELFRSKYHDLESQLTGLVKIAKDNDTSSSRMHELTLALLEAKNIEEVASNLDKVFTDCFLTDYSSIRIIKNNNEQPTNNIFVNTDDKNLVHFEKELNSNQSTCGLPTLAQAKFLFGNAVATEIKSSAIIPMSFTNLEGLIAIGSKDENRFHYSMGNLFLTQMSEIIATRLITLLDS